MSRKWIPLANVVGQTGIIADGDWVESKDQDPNGDVRLIQLADVGDGEYLNKSNRFLTSEKANQLRCTFLSAGDVLVSRMADPIGRACIFPGDIRPCVAVVDICVIRPDPAIANADWVKYVINTRQFRSIVESRAVGATRPRISGKNLKAIEIEVPDLPEQRRIVDILSRAEGIVRLRRDAQRKTAELMPGIFLDMFGDPATNPKGWNAAPLGELCDVKGGGTPSKQNPDFWIGEIPWVSPKDMSGVDFIVDAEDHISLNAVKSSATNLIPVGSVLIVTRSGVLKHTIPCAITAREVAINQDIKAFVPRKGMAPHFLLSQIQIRAKEILGLVRVGATVQNIETESLKRMRFIYPSLENQVKFIEKCEQIRSIQSQQAAATAKAQAAFEALLAQAFVAK